MKVPKGTWEPTPGWASITSGATPGRSSIIVRAIEGRHGLPCQGHAMRQAVGLVGDRLLLGHKALAATDNNAMAEVLRAGVLDAVRRLERGTRFDPAERWQQLRRLNPANRTPAEPVKGVLRQANTRAVEGPATLATLRISPGSTPWAISFRASPRPSRASASVTSA